MPGSAGSREAAGPRVSPGWAAWQPVACQAQQLALQAAWCRARQRAWQPAACQAHPTALQAAWCRARWWGRRVALLALAACRGRCWG